MVSFSFLSADVIGFQEMEDDGYGPDSAVAAFVDARNAKDGPGTWEFVNPDATRRTAQPPSRPAGCATRWCP
ncbi:MAG: hypothetical protein ACRDXB_12265 [Actinomycetes bacterium]